MYRIAVTLIFSLCAGCSTGVDLNAVNQGRNTKEEGGVVKRTDRETAEAFLAALSNVKSVEEEKALLTEFGEWLRINEYRIRVEAKNGKHDLSCPYFPPVTPWTSHSFFDIRNLELLPRLDDGT